MILTPEEYKNIVPEYEPTPFNLRGNPDNKSLLKKLTKDFGFKNEGQALDYIFTVYKQVPDLQDAYNGVIETCKQEKVDMQADFDKKLQAKGDEVSGLIQVKEHQEQIIKTVSDQLRPFIQSSDLSFYEALQRVYLKIDGQASEITALKLQSQGVTLKDSDVVISFDELQLKDIGKLRIRLKKISPDEKYDEPEQVIHASVAFCNEFIDGMLEMAAPVKALLDGR